MQATGKGSEVGRRRRKERAEAKEKMDPGPQWRLWAGENPVFPLGRGLDNECDVEKTEALSVAVEGVHEIKAVTD